MMITSQAILFITSVEIGVLMGVLFDLIRIFRKLIKHPNFLVQIEDMLYWIVCGFVAFYRLYICNYADIRPYIFLGILLGAIFYFATFSVIFMKIATVVIKYLKALIKKMISWIVKPIKFMLRTLVKWVNIPIRYISKRWHHLCYINKLKYRQYKRKRYEVKSDKKVEEYLRKSKS